MSISKVLLAFCQQIFDENYDGLWEVFSLKTVKLVRFKLK